MNEMERQGRFIEAQRAQSGLTIPEALEMLRNDGQARPSLEFGLEIAGAGSPDDATPAEMSEIDPGWASYLVRQEEAADAPWLAAAGSLEHAALAKGRLAYQTAAEDSEVLAAAFGRPLERRATRLSAVPGRGRGRRLGLRAGVGADRQQHDG